MNKIDKTIYLNESNNTKLNMFGIVCGLQSLVGPHIGTRQQVDYHGYLYMHRR